MTEGENIPAIPPLQKDLEQRPNSKPRDVLEEKLIAPLVEKMRPLNEIADGLFAERGLETEAEQWADQTNLGSFLNTGRPKRLETDYLPSDPEDFRRLCLRDLEERELDRANLHLSLMGKLGVAELVSATAQKELNFPYRRESDVHPAVLESVARQAKRMVEEITSLTAGVLDIEVDPLADSAQVQVQKQTLMYLSHLLAGLSLSTERVSPEMVRMSVFHRGLMQAEVKRVASVVSDRPVSVYNREGAGTWAHLLGINMASEFRLPGLSPEADSQIEVFSSGMGALGAVMEAVESFTSPAPEVVVTSGFYFELVRVAKDLGIIDDPVSVDEELYQQIERKVKMKTNHPLAVFAQPYSSNIDDQVFDVSKTLEIIKSQAGERPIILVLDSTMHGSSLNLWEKTKEIADEGIDFTVIEVQSLVKHGQLGMDTVPGGVALAYGSHPELVRTATGSRGVMMPEYNAAVLFPFSAEAQTHRINRAGRNAAYLAERLAPSIEENPIFDSIHFAPNRDAESGRLAKQYGVLPPFLFIEVNPLAVEAVSEMLRGYAGVHRVFPESGVGTSYGFDGTRIERIPAGKDGTDCIRIAAGQESLLPLMAISERFRASLNDPKLMETVSWRLKHEISQIVRPSWYLKKTIADRFRFPSSFYDGRKVTKSIDSTVLYFSDQNRGWQIVRELEKNKALADQLNLPEDNLAELRENLDDLSIIRERFVSWAISQPEFVEDLRKRLSIKGRMPSAEAAYQVARAVMTGRGKKGKERAFPLVRKTLQELRPYFEERVGVLPFEI